MKSSSSSSETSVYTAILKSSAQLARQFERNVLVCRGYRFDGGIVAFTKGRDDLIDQDFGSRGSSRNAESRDTVELFPVDIGGTLQQRGTLASGPLGHFNQPLGIGTVGGANHDHAFAARCDTLDGDLPVCRGIADIFLVRPDDGGKT